ncbi:SRPBCC family protein [Salinimicrobium sp. GXAS 041]|uniref:SRPBCC family protein n=1 Tax=Salinimicrobium sp. GXAS 041 TaxID=3400806 RepID=UPI003C789884
MANIYHQVLIDASNEEIYAAVTTCPGLSQWFIKNCDAKPEVGYVNSFRRPNGVTNLMKVTELNKNEFVQWNCQNEADGWSGTTLSFEISRKGELGCLDFRHNDYKDTNQFYAICNYQWARHLTMLKNFCESGKNQLTEEREKLEEEYVRRAHNPGKSRL